jgi:hypothetical protein
MFQRVFLSLALVAAAPAWSQIGSVPYDVPTTSAEAPMLTPPPVSVEGYPNTVGSQERSNYLTAGLHFSTAYNDNVLPAGSITPVSDFIFTILPTIALDKTTSRQHLALTYSPGFTFYQHTSALNAADQNASIHFQYRLSQHTTISLNDSFQKSTNVFDQLYPVSGGAAPSEPPTAVLAPYANQLRNTANVGVSYQFSNNGMIGASGNFMESNYPNQSQVAELYNSNSLGGSLFYNQRLSETQYIGVAYQYSRSNSSPVSVQVNPVNLQPEVQTHTIFAFYTIYFNPTLSLSLSGGPLYSNATQYPSPSSSSLTPSIMASIGWQKSHTNFVASYSRTVTGSLGLPGAFDSNSANGAARWEIMHTWTIGLAANYSNNKNITPSLPSSNPGGQTFSGTVSMQHSISEHLGVELGYARLHQNYSDIPIISTAPDSNREYISISYRFMQPLGR